MSRNIILKSSVWSDEYFADHPASLWWLCGQQITYRICFKISSMKFLAINCFNRNICTFFPISWYRAIYSSRKDSLKMCMTIHLLKAVCYKLKKFGFAYTCTYFSSPCVKTTLPNLSLRPARNFNRQSAQCNNRTW